jgi:hypothetical protein
MSRYPINPLSALLLHQQRLLSHLILIRQPLHRRRHLPATSAFALKSILILFAKFMRKIKVNALEHIAT